VDAFLNAFRNLLVHASMSDGNLVATSLMALDRVDWGQKTNRPTPARHSISDKHLEKTCVHSGRPGSPSRALAESLLVIKDRLEWRASSKAEVDGPDIENLLRNFAVATVIGEGGLLHSDDVVAGFSLQAPDTYYPPHAHRAEESYWIIGGDADWKIDTDPWFPIQPGDSIYHRPWARHVMQTNKMPLLTVWMWTSDLNSEVVIIRN